MIFAAVIRNSRQLINKISCYPAYLQYVNVRDRKPDPL